MCLFLEQGTSCGPYHAPVQHVLHYMAWSEVWEKEDWTPGPYRANLSLEYIVENSRTFWYIPARRLIVSFWPRVGSQYFVTSCQPEEKAWPNCVRLFEDTTTIKPALTDLLLGKSPPVRRLSGAKICHRTILGRDQALWKPSPDSPVKRSLITDLKNKIGEFAGTRGNITNVVIADFNLLDPKIFAVVDMESEGRRHRALAVATLNQLDQSVHIVSLYEEGQAEGSIVTDVLSRGIRAQ
jgi:hypothetical protein